MSYPTCLVCGKAMRPKGTGRPPRYCSNRCKEKARRERDRERDRFSRNTVEAPEPGAVEVDSGVTSDAVCRVCEINAASVGPPGNPILCSSCAAA